MKIITPKAVKCHRCKGTGLLHPHNKISSPDINKMKKILIKNNLSRTQVAKLLKKSVATINFWFSPSRNTTGKIKKIYFDELKAKGYTT